MYGIIYKTTNTLNGKIYVGQHKTQVIDDGYMGSGRLIQRALKKYGAENFLREVLEVVLSREEANLREEFWIRELGANNPTIGYNITQYAWGGQPLTEESRAKISAAHTGKILSEETKEKMRKPKSACARKKMTDVQKALGEIKRAQNKKWFHNPATGESGQFAANEVPAGWLLGRGPIQYKNPRVFSEAGLEALRENARDPNRRKKVSKTLLGHAVSEHTKQKISNSLKAKGANNEKASNNPQNC